MKHILIATFVLVFSVGFSGYSHSAAVPPNCVDDALAMPYDDALDHLINVCGENALASEISDRYDRLVSINDGFLAGFGDDDLKALALSSSDADIDAFEVAQQELCVARALSETYTVALDQLNNNCNASALASEIEARFNRLVQINTDFLAGFSNGALMAMALGSTDADIDVFEAEQRELCISRALSETYTVALDRLNNNCDASDLADEIEARFNRLVGINTTFDVGYTVAELQNFAMTRTDADVDELENELVAIDSTIPPDDAPNPTGGSLGPGTGATHIDQTSAECPDPIAGVDAEAIFEEVRQACSFAGFPCSGDANLRSMVFSAIDTAGAEARALCQSLYPQTVIHDIFSILGFSPPTVIPYSGAPVSDAELAAEQAAAESEASAEATAEANAAIAEAAARQAAADAAAQAAAAAAGIPYP